MNITQDLIYVGVNDREIDLFEGQYVVPNGISYNSYVLMDDQIAVFDTVDIHFGEQWLNQLQKALQGRKPDYLIVLHMEPDHSANIMKFLEAYPETTLIGNAKTFMMMDQFFELDPNIRKKVVENNEALNLGHHELTFVFAPMVHWPEVMMCYDAKDQVLFSADAFGKFGIGEEEWIEEARRYYIGIVGKYGAQVLAVLKKAENLPLSMICPLHGPVLKENIAYYVECTRKWAAYEAEKQGVVIAYTSVYGHTKEAALYLADQLKQRNVETVVYDLARSDMSQAVSDAFCYDKLVLATPTYNADVFPYMKTFIHQLIERNYQNRKVALIENGSWAATANQVMKNMLAKSKDVTIVGTATIRSSLKQDSRQALKELAEELSR